MRRIWVGTGAIAFKEWKGQFYPKNLTAINALAFYAKTFSALELNSSFYRMPTAAAIEEMTAAAPANFPISVKMPRLLTHIKRLRNSKALMNDTLKVLPRFDVHLGPLLFQLPPNFPLDLKRLKEFLPLIPSRYQVAIEFRHRSWFVKPVFDLLKKKHISLVYNDTDIKMPLIATCDWGYLRLRKLHYSNRALETWIKKIKALKWKTTWVIFKHEEKATAPPLAQRFRTLGRF